jgi:FkbM family methyltransferase
MTALSLRRAWRSFRYRRLQRRLAGRKLLTEFARRRPDTFFIEVGANDGVQHDHLRPFIVEGGWRGVMVEPVPYVFERLRHNYKGFDLIEFENAAIADRDGTLPFFYLRPPRAAEDDHLPDWYDGIGSFSRDLVMSHARHIPDIGERLMRTEVPALTFESLCRKHRVTRLDLVLIDAEGYDLRILETIDLASWHPALLVYEHYHLDHEEQRRAGTLVRDHGYETMEEGFNTWCLDPRADERLTGRWRELRPAVPGVFAADERK